MNDEVMAAFFALAAVPLEIMVDKGIISHPDLQERPRAKRSSLAEKFGEATATRLVEAIMLHLSQGQRTAAVVPMKPAPD